MLIVDTSYSITKSNFVNQIKPFLLGLAYSKILNVGQDGTHIALMLFSSKKKIDVKLGFSTGYTKATLNRTIVSLVWEEVMGDQTRTDLALKKATEVKKDGEAIHLNFT